jgi:hypothetical protein
MQCSDLLDAKVYLLGLAKSLLGKHVLPETHGTFAHRYGVLDRDMETSQLHIGPWQNDIELVHGNGRRALVILWLFWSCLQILLLWTSVIRFFYLAAFFIIIFVNYVVLVFIA